MFKNSLGTFTVATQFIPLFPQTKKEFKPLEIKKVAYEDCKTKATESVCSTVYEAESGITPQNQQTASQTAEQADS